MDCEVLGLWMDGLDELGVLLFVKRGIWTLAMIDPEIQGLQDCTVPPEVA